MLNVYSKQGCLFECRLENAFELTGCIPWDYPIPPSLEKEHNYQIKMCNSSKPEDENLAQSDLAKFDDYMSEEDSVRNCSCLPDCEEVVFETQVIICQYRAGFLSVARFCYVFHLSCEGLPGLQH